MSVKELTFNVDDITFGQVEFLTDETGCSVNEVMEKLRTGAFAGRDLVVVLALATDPDDPARAMEEIRKTRVADIKLNIPEPE